jgi:hypothetical protein
MALFVKGFGMRDSMCETVNAHFLYRLYMFISVFIFVSISNTAFLCLGNSEEMENQIIQRQQDPLYNKENKNEKELITARAELEKLEKDYKTALESLKCWHSMLGKHLRRCTASKEKMIEDKKKMFKEYSKLQTETVALKHKLNGQQMDIKHREKILIAKEEKVKAEQVILASLGKHTGGIPVDIKAGELTTLYHMRFKAAGMDRTKSDKILMELMVDLDSMYQNVVLFDQRVVEALKKLDEYHVNYCKVWYERKHARDVEHKLLWEQSRMPIWDEAAGDELTNKTLAPYNTFLQLDADEAVRRTLLLEVRNLMEQREFSRMKLAELHAIKYEYAPHIHRNYLPHSMPTDRVLANV